MFELDTYAEFHWRLVLNTHEVGQLYRTFSPLQRLDPVDREHLIERLMLVANDRFDGRVTRYMTSPLYLFRRL